MNKPKRDIFFSGRGISGGSYSRAYEPHTIDVNDKAAETDN